MRHYYDPRKVEYMASPHKFLVQKWHEAHNIPFPPTHPLWFEDEDRTLVYNNTEVPVRTPPPWIGKVVR